MSDFDRYGQVRENVRKRIKDIDDKCKTARLKDIESSKQWSNINYDLHKKHDSIYTMPNNEATILYIAVMLGGSIFNDRLIIWIVATIVYFLHLTRHSRR